MGILPGWFVLAGVCSICYALEGIWIKKLKEFSPEFLAWCTAAFTLPFFLAALWFEGWPQVKPQFYWPFIICLIGNTAGLTCYFRAFSYGEVSIVYPLLALTPTWMLFTTKHITGEFPIALGLAGVLLSTFGCYALGLDRSGLLSPFRNIRKHPGARWALITSIIWSVTANYDKAAIAASSATFHPATHAIALAVTLYAVFGGKFGQDFKRLATFRGAWRILVLVTLVSVLVLSQYVSVAHAQTTYVISIKRSGMVLGVLLGWLLLKEPYGARRFGLSLIVLAGLLLILLG